MTYPRGITRAPHQRGGGELNLWIWVMIYALRDWQYGRLDITWFNCHWCKEVSMMIGPLGFMVVRFWFTQKARMAPEKKQKIAVMIDKLEKNC